MVARKTKVSLLWSLLMGWAVWIIVNFIEKTVSAWCPGHFYWKNMLSQEYIDILWDELNDTDFHFLKKVFYCTQGLAATAPPLVHKVKMRECYQENCATLITQKRWLIWCFRLEKGLSFVCAFLFVFVFVFWFLSINGLKRHQRKNSRIFILTKIILWNWL